MSVLTFDDLDVAGFSSATNTTRALRFCDLLQTATSNQGISL